MKNRIIRICMLFVMMFLVVITKNANGYAFEYSNSATMNWDNQNEAGEAYFHSSESDLQNNISEKETSIPSVVIRFYIDNYIKAVDKASVTDCKVTYTVTNDSGESEEKTASFSTKDVTEPENESDPTADRTTDMYGYYTATENNTYTFSYKIKRKGETEATDITEGSATVSIIGEKGLKGGDPTADIQFKLSSMGGTNVGSDGQTGTKDNTVYRYKQSITAQCVARDNEYGDGESGLKYVEFISGGATSGQISCSGEKEKTVAGKTYTGDYEDIKDEIVEVQVGDKAEKVCSSNPSAVISDYVKKHHRVDAKVASATSFKPYLVNGDTMVQINITYGEEFVNNEKLNQSDLNSKTGGYKCITINTKNKPTVTSTSAPISYDNNEGSPTTTAVPYTIPKQFVDAYNNHKFDISTGNIEINGDTVTFGKTLGLEAGEQKESTVTLAPTDTIILTGTSNNQYTVKISGQSSERIIKLDNLRISSGSTSPIDITDGSKIKLVTQNNDSEITSSGSNNAININSGELVVTGEKKLTVKCTGSGGGIASNGGGKITITDAKLDITTKDGAGIGSGQGGSVGTIELTNVSGTITIKDSANNSAGGAGIGSGKNGTSGEITVKNPNLTITIPSYGTGAGIGSGEGVSSTTSVQGGVVVKGNKVTITNDGKGACIGSGKSGTISGGIEITSLDAKLKCAASGCGLGAGNEGKCGNISVWGGVITMQTGTAGVGIGAATSGTCTSITLGANKKGNRTDFIAEACAVGIGANTSGTCGRITIQGASQLNIKSSTVGIGAIGETTGEIKIEDSSKAKILATYVGIGASGTCGNITINSSSIQIGNSTSKPEIGIGAKEGGKVEAISITGGITDIYASKTGIGNSSFTNSAGAITISGAKVQVTGAITSIGANENATVGSISINSNSEINLTTSVSGSTKYVGIGSNTGGTVNGGTAISISASKLSVSGPTVGIGSNSSEAGEKITIASSTISVSGAVTGIGASSSGEVGDISITANSNAKISSSNVAIGADEDCTAGEITIGSSNLEVSGTSVSIGANKQGTVGAIKINANSKLKITGTDVGVGAHENGTAGTITISSATLSITSNGIGIGGAKQAEAGNITIGGSTIKITSNLTAIGSQSGSTNMTITINSNSNIHITVNGDDACGIGAGDLSKVSNITISSCKNIRIGVINGVGIGCGSSGTCGAISIDSTPIVVSASQTGIGCRTSGNIVVSGGGSAIKINRCNPISVTASSNGIGGASGGNIGGDIEILGASNVKVSVTGNGAGIGGEGVTIGKITISGKSIINVQTTGTGAAIGGSGESGAEIGDISIDDSTITTKTSSGVGIGGNLNTIGITKSRLKVSTSGYGTGIGAGSGEVTNINIGNCVVTVTGTGGSASTGAGIGCGSGIVGNTNLTSNTIGVIKDAGSTGAAIGSGEGGNAGNITMTGNKIAVAASNGAGIGSGKNGKVTGTIELKNGTVIAKSATGAGIGGGLITYSSSENKVNNITITNGRVYATITDHGAGIGSGQGGSVDSITINNGEVVCNVAGDGAGIGSGYDGNFGTLTIGNGKVDVKSAAGAAMGGTSGNVTITDGTVYAMTTGDGSGIGGSNVTINGGVVKASSGRGNDLSGTVNISTSANVQAYNNRTSSTVKRDGGTSVSQKKLTTDMLRYIDGTASIIDGGTILNTIKTDTSGNIYLWMSSGDDFELDMNNMRFKV